jgi:DNA-directed RNA polymerase specialized sigma24 family protein
MAGTVSRSRAKFFAATVEGNPGTDSRGHTGEEVLTMLAADEDADFSAYAAEAWARLYRRAFLLAGYHADAEDLAQQTLIRARRHWAKVVSAGSPDAYVTRILTNVYLSSRRRARVGREVLRPSSCPPGWRGPTRSPTPTAPVGLPYA